MVLGSAAAAGGPERVILPVTINHVDKGDLLVLVREGDVMARVGDLAAAGVHGFSGLRESSGDGEFVSLASLAPQARFALDAEAIALDLTVPPDWLGSTVKDLTPGRPPGLIYSTDTSAFFNYAVTGEGVRNLDAFGEAGVSLRGDLAYSSFSRTREGETVRGLTSYTRDNRERLRRFVWGDSLAAAGGLGGALFLGGFGMSRNFDLDPYFIRTPTLSFSGAVTTPSTADVYVNGSIVRREQIPPGQFDLTNLSLPAGSGTAEVVVRDAFGQERTLTNPFYAGSAVLAPGLTEYTFGLGFRRDRVGTRSGDYGGLAFLGRYRFGWTDRLTPEGRLEADADVVSGGGGLAARLPFGEFEGSFGLSRDDGRRGAAGSLVYRYLGRPVNFGAVVRALSTDYATLSLRAAQDRPRLETSLLAGISIGPRVSLTAQYGSSIMRDAPGTERLSLSSTVALVRRVNLLVSGGRARRGGKPETEAFVGLSCFLDHATTGSLSGERQGGASGTWVDVQKSLPLGTGYGYRASGFSGTDRDGASGAFQFQGPYGRYEARSDRVNGKEVSSVSVSGGVVAIGGAVVPTRAVGDSFALIRVPGLGGVMGLSNNQPIARTNQHGDILVPNLMPYYGNRLGISDQDVPLDYGIEATEKVVAPPYRGGTLVGFPVQKIRSVRGSVVLIAGGQEVRPALGEITVAAGGRQFSSPLGTGGEFDLANLPTGRVLATVESQAGRCSFTIDVPNLDKAIIDLGILRCRTEVAR